MLQEIDSQRGTLPVVISLRSLCVCVLSACLINAANISSCAGPCFVDSDVVLDSELTWRFPAEDHESLPFPNGVEAFIFPCGAKISRERIPYFCHSFVLTQAKGERLFGYCCTSYVQASHSQLSHVRMQLAARMMNDDNPVPELLPNTLYVPVVLCILSLSPFHNSFLKLLGIFAETYIGSGSIASPAGRQAQSPVSNTKQQLSPQVQQPQQPLSIARHSESKRADGDPGTEAHQLVTTLWHALEGKPTPSPGLDVFVQLGDSTVQFQASDRSSSQTRDKHRDTITVLGCLS